MPNLKDGESLEMQGSASRPYVLKNLGGVFSCSCAAWRFQSLPIERRTCRHLRALRGDEAENARVGVISSTETKERKSTPTAPRLLLAERWDSTVDPTGYWMSEKLDGLRSYWDGERFLSRNGNCFHAPAWFTAGLPSLPLDGELWIGRKQFQRTMSVVRRHDQTDLWKAVRFVVFDAPAHDWPFETRLKQIEQVISTQRPPYAIAHPHTICRNLAHLQAELARVEALAGEGLMLRQPGSLYEVGRSDTLLKVKNFHDSEARVIGHEPGKNRHKGRLGALLVEMDNGVRFAIGTGFTDAEREHPPSSGSTITFRYQELTDGGVPRFPSFVRVHGVDPPPFFAKGELAMSQSATSRRFEFVGGGSDKFWKIDVTGKEVAVCFGRNGTTGQRSTKSFSDSAAATRHAEKLIREKLGKGYVEIH